MFAGSLDHDAAATPQMQVQLPSASVSSDASCHPAVNDDFGDAQRLGDELAEARLNAAVCTV